MKLHKNKIGLLLLLTGMLLCLPVSVFAAQITTPTPITITSGLDLNAEETESTFDATRTVYGEAKPSTQIQVSVSRKNINGDMQVTNAQSVTVSSVGIFSATVDLDMGYNYITLTAQKEGYEQVSQTVVIKRLPQRIKKELQNMIALPGTY